MAGETESRLLGAYGETIEDLGPEVYARRRRIALRLGIGMLMALTLAYAAYRLDHSEGSRSVVAGRVVKTAATGPLQSLGRPTASRDGASLIEASGRRFWRRGTLPVGHPVNVELTRGRITGWTYVDSVTVAPTAALEATTASSAQPVAP